tara:strand:- start:9412 stop:9630 length:219 start_codon:yes stop_codon:yes gene_type:complete
MSVNKDQKNLKAKIAHETEMKARKVFNRRANKILTIIGVPLIMAFFLNMCLDIIDYENPHRPPAQVEDVWEK